MSDQFDFQGGEMLLVDKPLTWTSFDAVKKLKYNIRHLYGFKKIKIGHAGTLDPLATGLLIICTGKNTKKINDFMNLPKVYSGTLMLGGTTPSYDLESEVSETFPTDHITPESIQAIIAQFSGEITQTPPIFSAIKINGRKAYDLARKGEEVEIKSRQVVIHSLELDSTNFPEIKFLVKCSKGTYIRSLANDIGKALNSGAHLTTLRRESIGEYDVKDAKSPQDWIDELTSKSNLAQ